MTRPELAADPISTGKQLRELLGKQIALYQRLERLSLAQRDCIEREDPRPLLSLLAERQRLTAALTDLGAQLAPHRLHWEAVKGLLPTADRVEVEARLRDVSDRLRRILDGDEADARLLASRRDATAGDLRGLDAAWRTHHAYSSAVAAPGGVLDGTEA